MGEDWRNFEFFEIYDEAGRHLGAAPRSECHGNPEYVHHTSHVVIRNHAGHVLLQKRAANKDIQPGKWDSAVGGHVNLGENFRQAALRETREELGLTLQPADLHELFTMRIRNSIESEDVMVFSAEQEGPFDFQRSEIETVRFFTPEELHTEAWQKEFTPNLVEEIKMLESFNLL